MNDFRTFGTWRSKHNVTMPLSRLHPFIGHAIGKLQLESKTNKNGKVKHINTLGGVVMAFSIGN
jgi:hypothetical protein